jgi:predicted anti-sigma-YlaC factor YlaD
MTAREPTPADPVLVVACREFVELATEHLEGTLPAELERAVAAHLEFCDPCVEYLDQLQRTARLLRTLPTQTLPPVVRNRLLEVYTRLHRTPG